MTEPTRVLAEGVIRYRGALDGSYDVDWMTARVFVIEYEPGGYSDGDAYVTVVAREPLYLPLHRVPAPVGSIHHLPATYANEYDEFGGAHSVDELLTLDVEALVPA